MVSFVFMIYYLKFLASVKQTVIISVNQMKGQVKRFADGSIVTLWRNEQT